MFKNIVLRASLVALAGAAPSAATIYTITYAGTISGVVQQGAAGPASAIHDGQSFLTRYTIDTGLGLRTTSSPVDEVAGGPATGLTLPVTTAFFVDGVRQSAFTTTPYASAHLDAGSFDLTSAIANFSSTSSTFYGLYTSTALSNQPVDLDIQPHGFAASASSGRYISYAFNAVTGTYDSLELGQLDIASVAVNSLVPEPATWVLLITGFGLAGTAARRRRRLVAD